MAHRAPAGVARQRVALVGDGAVGRELARGLRQRGLAVAAVDPQPAYDAALRRAADALGGIDAVVWAATPPGLTRAAALVELAAERWQELVGGTLRGYVELLQAAHRQVAADAGRIVVVVPTLALAGAAGLVAWSAVADGQRALAKSAARAWGRHGVTVNCVAVPAALFAGSPEGLDRPELQPAALEEPDLARDVAAVVATLLGEDMAAVSGATLGVDGGRWMPA